METKEAIIVLYHNMENKVSDVYDNNENVSSALNSLIEGFEYPDFSHKTIKQVLLSYFKKNFKPFNPGKCVVAGELIEDYQERQEQLFPFIDAHVKMQQGELCDDDLIENYLAVFTFSGRLLSSFELFEGRKIFIITDWETEETPRVTTLMYCEDY
ncbi:hypothetical protein [Aquitalea pelogenes]|uniref:hypothetical protein n=1 Tax=Aquitalea pelogenes TaxID=1293573 RepID=UPI0035B2DB18